MKSDLFLFFYQTGPEILKIWIKGFFGMLILNLIKKISKPSPNIIFLKNHIFFSPQHRTPMVNKFFNYAKYFTFLTHNHHKNLKKTASLIAEILGCIYEKRDTLLNIGVQCKNSLFMGNHLIKPPNFLAKLFKLVTWFSRLFFNAEKNKKYGIF